MPADGVIRAVDHPYRRNILHILSRGSLTYSQLFASMEPRGGGRGRFNYHLKLLREAGLIQSQENHYGLTEIGEAAVSFLEGVSKHSNARVRLNIPRRHIGPLLGFSILGLASALLVWSILAPVADVPPAPPLEAGWGAPTSIETDAWGNTRTGSGLISRGGIQGLKGVIDNSGNGLAVWTLPETYYSPGVISESRVLQTARFVPGVGWGKITSIDTPWEGAVPSIIAVDGTGSIFALWSGVGSDGASGVYASRFIPSRGWIDTTLLDQAGAGQVSLVNLATSSSERAFAAWLVDGEMYGSLHSNRGWESPVRLGPSEGGWAHIGLNARGDAVVIWQESIVMEGDVYESVLWANVFEATSGWEGPVRSGTWRSIDGWSDAFASFIETLGGGWGSLSLEVYGGDYLTVDDGGNAVHVWRPGGGGWEPGPVFWSRYVRGTGWTAPEVIEPAAGYVCAFEGSGYGDVILLWASGQLEHTLASSFTPEVGWTNPESVGTKGCPRLVAIGPTGNAFVVWVGPSTPISEGGDRAISANYFVRPQTLEDLVEDIGYQLDRSNARLMGLELRFLLLAGVIVALMASNGIFLSLYWYRRPGLAPQTGLREERNEQPRRRG